MKKYFSIALIGALLAAVTASAQDSYTGTNSSGNWFTARWNNSSDAAPYTSAFTTNNNAIFTSGNYTFTGMGSASAVGNITLLDNVNVTFTSIGSSLATGGNVRTITVGSGSILELTNQAISSAAGTGFIKNGAGVYATAGNSYQGGFTLNAGTVIARAVNAMGGGSTNVLTLNGGTVAGNATRSFDNTKFGGGIFIGGNVQFGELSNNVAVASSTANLSFANNVSLGAANRTFTLGNQGTQTFSGIISNTGTGGLTFVANAGTTGGLFALTGIANTFAGDVTINGGEARFTADGSLGNSANNIVIDGGTFSSAIGATNTIASTRGIFVGDGAGTSINAMGASGKVIYDGVIADKSGETGSFAHGGFGTLQLGGANTYSGTTTITSGVVVVTNGGRLGSTTSSVAISGGTFDLGAQTRTNAALAMSGGTITNGTLEAASYVISGGTVAAVLAGTGGLQKTGAGTATLSGANTYTGPTSVLNGRLNISGSVSSDVTISAGATLAGLGTITGDLSFESGANFDFNLAGSLIVNTGTVSFGGFSLNNVVGLTSAVDIGRYTLIGGTATFNFDNVSDFGVSEKVDIGGGKFAYLDSGSFVVEVIPEPSTYALLALAGVGFTGYVIRRRRR